MIRTTAAPRTTTRLTASAAVGVLGALALAGCASAAPAPADPEPTTDSQTDGGATDGGATGDASVGDRTYADGTYSADGSYATPESVETISVTVTLADSVITAVEVSGDPQRAESERYQGEFIGGISDEVVGVPIDEISVSRVAGSSLTSGGFNDAIEMIKADAVS